jgi:2-dehydro-3-deoxy-L-rhamnonate dehydrogenase (NAD+)
MYLDRFKLAGRTAVITGGGRGIGLACADALGEAGARVVIADHNAAVANSGLAFLRGKGHAAEAIMLDVTDSRRVEEAAAQTVSSFGSVDILVCNAGIAGPTAPLWEYPVEDWRRVVEIDLTGVFLCLRAVVPLMVAQNYGRICSTASIAGKEGNPNASAYSAAKAGVIALTKSLGKELAGHDIAVNCITPAAARTRIFEQISQEHVDYMLSKIPRGRFVQVEEIAAMVAWLVSSENSFTTGAVFDLSGGRATY